MSTRTIAIDDTIAEYVRNHALTREDEILAALREETAELPMSMMQISVEQGRLMALLTMILGVTRAIEVGVFTGYSSLCVARHMPADGKLVACDVSDEWTSVARKYWDRAGVADRIDLRLAPAGETLAAMIDAGEAASYDFAFIDADKEAYPGYYEQILTLLRPGGAMLLDNIFMGGRAIAPKDEAGPVAMHGLTRAIFDDDRVDPSLIPIGDGVVLARKR